MRKEFFVHLLEGHGHIMRWIETMLLKQLHHQSSSTVQYLTVGSYRRHCNGIFTLLVEGWLLVCGGGGGVGGRVGHDGLEGGGGGETGGGRCGGYKLWQLFEVLLKIDLLEHPAT